MSRKIFILTIILLASLVSKGYCWDRNWDYSSPLGSANANTIDTAIQDTKKSLGERLNADHWFGDENGDINALTAGDHRQVTMLEKSSHPSAETSTGILYTYADGTDTELYYEDASGNDVKITEDGGLYATFSNLTASGTLNVTGASTLTGSVSMTNDCTITGNLSVAGLISGTEIVQKVVSDLTGSGTTTTQMVIDDSIPQITEGKEFFSVLFTPKDANNWLQIDVYVFTSSGTGGAVNAAAVFKDGGVNAIAAGLQGQGEGAALPNCISFSFQILAGSTSEQEFSVNCGCASGSTFTFNGVSSGRIFGGVLASGMTITEFRKGD